MKPWQFAVDMRIKYYPVVFRDYFIDHKTLQNPGKGEPKTQHNSLEHLEYPLTWGYQGLIYMFVWVGVTYHGWVLKSDVFLPPVLVTFLGDV